MEVVLVLLSVNISLMTIVAVSVSHDEANSRNLSLSEGFRHKTVTFGYAPDKLVPNASEMSKEEIFNFATKGCVSHEDRNAFWPR